MEQLYHREFSRFQESWAKLNKKQKKEMELFGREQMLDIYNELSGFRLTKQTSEKELRRGTLTLLKLFSDLEPEFRNRDFLEWMFKKGELSPAKLREAIDIAESNGFDLKLGDFLRQSYKKYASFQDIPLYKNKEEVGGLKEKVSFFWQAFKKEAPSCDTLDCVNAKSRSMWSDLFSAKYYKDSFSCLAHNPLVLKTMIMDLGLIWGGLYWFYKDDEEGFQRFPYEMIVNGAIFAPIMAEANCRASFKGALPFGGKIPKDEVFAGGLKRFGRAVKNWKGVAFKGFLSSVGLLSFSMGFDHLFLAMGESIAKPLVLNDVILLLPITFLYHGAWMSFKHLAIINPMRHKILPRLAEKLTKKLGGKFPFLATQTLLDLAMFKAIMYGSQWDYLLIYQNNLLPYVMGSFTAGATLEHKREISPTGETLDTYEGVSESGISSHMVIKEEEGKIQLQSVDADVPEDTLESWADEVLKGIEND